MLPKSYGMIKRNFQSQEIVSHANIEKDRKIYYPIADECNCQACHFLDCESIQNF
jgi:hypothetical protein